MPTLEQELGEHTHARPNLKGGLVAVVIERGSDALGDAQVGQKVLTQ